MANRPYPLGAEEGHPRLDNAWFSNGEFRGRIYGSTKAAKEEVLVAAGWGIGEQVWANRDVCGIAYRRRSRNFGMYVFFLFRTMPRILTPAASMSFLIFRTTSLLVRSASIT